MELEAKIEGDNVIISKDCFRYLLKCRDVENDIRKLGGNIWEDMLIKIDDYFNQCKKFLNDR